MHSFNSLERDRTQNLIPPLLTALQLDAPLRELPFDRHEPVRRMNSAKVRQQKPVNGLI
jgi:hypothetical protein